MDHHIFYTCRESYPDSSEIRFTDSFQFGLILNGEGQLQYRGKTVYLHRGDFFFFPKHSLFLLTNMQALEIFEIHLMSYFFQTLCPELETVFFHHFSISENRNDNRCNDIYHRLATFVYDNIQYADSLQSLTAVSQLFTALLAYFQGESLEDALKGNYLEHRVHQIMVYITEHHTEKITIPQISKAMGLNPQYFSSFFSRYFRQPFIDFLNQFRIHRSLSELCSSGSRITDIAMNYGFQTYKSYSNAFQKCYGMRPQEYRKLYLSQKNSNRISHPSERFDFLRKYLEPSSQQPKRFSGKSFSISLDLQTTPTLTTDHRIKAVSIGSAYQLLNNNVYEQLKRASAECGFTHVHFHDLFSDLLGVYTEPSPEHPIFTWDFILEILSKIRKLQMHPFIELGMMPRELAESPAALGYGSHSCIGKPRSDQLWQQMICSFLEHCLGRFGKEELQNWRFDFWNSANIRSADGYWNDTQEDFFHLYLITFRVFQEYSLESRLGTPNFSIPGGLGWYDDFLAFCRKNALRPGFLGVHLYSCEDHLTEFSGIFPYTPVTYNYLSSTGIDMVKEHLISLKGLLKKHQMDDLPILAGEWNITHYLSDLIRDTAFMATYVVRTWIQTLDDVQGLSYACLSDLNERYQPSHLPFSGGQGLFARQGFPQPAYHAFFLLHKLDPDIIWNEPPCLITKGDRQWHILLYHISDYISHQQKEPEFLSDDYRYNVFQDTDGLRFHGSFQVPEGTWRITSYTISQEAGSAYDAWMRMGKPALLTSEITQALEHASYPEIHVETKELKDSFRLELEVELSPHSVVLYELRPEYRV